MNKSYLNQIKEKKNYELSVRYITLLNYFKNINFAFPTCSINEHTFYRVRLHKNNEEFFYNESDLSYRNDIMAIKDFGRCNEPFQGMFYCSDNSELSLKEVLKDLDNESLKRIKYYTISIWKRSEEMLAAHFLGSSEEKNKNPNLLEMRLAFDRIIEDESLLGDKYELKEFLLEVFNQFKIPYSTSNKIYYLSAAFTNYLFNSVDETKNKIEGFIYPTCLGNEFESLGLNYVFQTDRVGRFGKIQMKGACRVNLSNPKDELFCQGIEEETGKLQWKY